MQTSHAIPQQGAWDCRRGTCGGGLCPTHRSELRRKTICLADCSGCRLFGAALGNSSSSLPSIAVTQRFNAPHRKFRARRAANSEGIQTDSRPPCARSLQARVSNARQCPRRLGLSRAQPSNRPGSQWVSFQKCRRGPRNFTELGLTKKFHHSLVRVGQTASHPYLGDCIPRGCIPPARLSRTTCRRKDRWDSENNLSYDRAKHLMQGKRI